MDFRARALVGHHFRVPKYAIREDRHLFPVLSCGPLLVCFIVARCLIVRSPPFERATSESTRSHGFLLYDNWSRILSHAGLSW